MIVEKTDLAVDMDVADIQAALQDDPEAFERLMERYQQKVEAIVWRFSRDPLVHEELVQDVYVALFLSLGGFRGSAPFGHWLSRVAVHVGYNHVRRVVRYRRQVSYATLEELEEMAGPCEDPRTVIDNGLDVCTQVNRLSPRCRHIFVLIFRGMDSRSIAQDIGRTQRTVDRQISAARQELLHARGRQRKN